MMRAPLTDEQLISAFKEAKPGVKVNELCCSHGMSSPPLDAWRAMFGGVKVSEAKRMRALEEENHQLTSMVGERALYIRILEAINEENGEPCEPPPSHARPLYFLQDHMGHGSRDLTLIVVDDRTRECLTSELYVASSNRLAGSKA